MDNNKSYIERRNHIKAIRSRRHLKPTKKWNSSLFLLRANICMGIAVLMVIASYIDSVPTNTVCDKVKTMIGENMSAQQVKDMAVSVYDVITDRDISVMAENTNNGMSLDREIIEQINAKKDVYYNNQKKTR